VRGFLITLWVVCGVLAAYIFLREIYRTDDHITLTDCVMALVFCLGGAAALITVSAWTLNDVVVWRKK
jgi:hypothetical protein